MAEAHPTTLEYLAHPKRLVTLSLPVVMDDGKVRIFQGYRVVHDIARGPAKGGVRLDPGVTLGQTAGLAAWMTLKAAVYDLPFGGAAGGSPWTPRGFPRRSWSAWCAATPPSSWASSGPTATSWGPTSGRTSRSWPGSWTPTP